MCSPRMLEQMHTTMPITMAAPVLTNPAPGVMPTRPAPRDTQHKFTPHVRPASSLTQRAMNDFGLWDAMGRTDDQADAGTRGRELVATPVVAEQPRHQRRSPRHVRVEEGLAVPRRRGTERAFSLLPSSHAHRVLVSCHQHCGALTCAATPSAVSADPALKPYQPKSSSAVPSITNGTCGGDVLSFLNVCQGHGHQEGPLSVREREEGARLWMCMSWGEAGRT